MIAGYSSPLGGEEYAIAFDRGRSRRLLVLPALFDEANKLRRLTVEVMRRLDGAGIDAFLPDWPGCNESLAPLEAQAFEDWREAADMAAAHFRANRVLAIRGGALLAPPLSGWSYAPVGGAALLNGLLRARTIATREAGLAETREELLEQGLHDGIELAGYQLSAAMVGDLHTAQPPAGLVGIAQADLGGPALWLRAEPDHDSHQADALAAIVAMGFAE